MGLTQRGVSLGTVPTAGAEPVSSALAAVIDELIGVLERTPDPVFQEPPADVPGIRSSIGAHVRHCVDHFKALQRGAAVGRIEYHVRERGAAIERDRHRAIACLREMRDEIILVPLASLDGAVEVSDCVSLDLPPLSFRSSLGREFLYVLSHTIHHHAVIGVLARAARVDVPDGFGYSPTTLGAVAALAAARRTGATAAVLGGAPNPEESSL